MMKRPTLLVTLVLASLGARESDAFISPAPFQGVLQTKAFQRVQSDGSQDVGTVQNVKSDGRAISTNLQALPASIAAIPLSQKIFLSCLVPTCAGFWRSEYGVSYAYGSAVALSSYWIYEALMAGGKSSSWAVWQAGALMFYGVRLCLFLAYREIFTQRMKESVERIENSSKAKGNRWTRIPFVVSCSGLYFGLVAPLLISSRVVSSTIPAWTVNVLKGLVASTWAGFIIGAIGDINKSIVKAIKGEDHLVTGGIYSLCRHPNYSGEFIAWTSSGFIALVAAISTKGAGLSVPQLVGYLAASVAGALGLDFVVLGATKGLEKRQKETYGGTVEYQQWVDSTWPGFELPGKSEEAAVTPEITVADTEEETGSGI